jgi:uncharacterized protein (DUF488 family)
VFTAGHGTRTTEELAGLLREAGVDLLVDVRRFPGSRRHPHFGREGLERALPELGIPYHWRGEELGGRRSRRRDAASRHPAWRNDAFAAYADYMDTDAFRAALTRLEQQARGGARLCVMCSETLWWRCHRRLISDALVLHGFDVVHLIQPGKRSPHPLNEAARAGDDGWPVYDVGVTGELPL